MHSCMVLLTLTLTLKHAALTRLALHTGSGTKRVSEAGMFLGALLNV